MSDAVRAIALARLGDLFLAPFLRDIGQFAGLMIGHIYSWWEYDCECSDCVQPVAFAWPDCFERRVDEAAIPPPMGHPLDLTPGAPTGPLSLWPTPLNPARLTHPRGVRVRSLAKCASMERRPAIRVASLLVFSSVSYSLSCGVGL